MLIERMLLQQATAFTCPAPEDGGDQRAPTSNASNASPRGGRRKKETGGLSNWLSQLGVRKVFRYPLILHFVTLWLPGERYRSILTRSISLGIKELCCLFYQFENQLPTSSSPGAWQRRNSSSSVAGSRERSREKGRRLTLPGRTPETSSTHQVPPPTSHPAINSPAGQ